MTGSTKDPSDGKAVAGSVFAAVVVYAVSVTDNNMLSKVCSRMALSRCSSSSAVSRPSYTFGRVRRGL